MGSEEQASSLHIDNQSVYFHNSEEMSAVIDDEADLIITSPPYWNLKDYGHENQIGHDEAYDDYLSRLDAVWKECYEVSDENAILIINIGDRRHQKKFYPIAMDIYNRMDDWKLLDNLIWHIPNALPQPAYYLDKLFDDKYENLLVFGKNYEYDFTFNKLRVPQNYRDAEPRDDKLNDDGRCIGNILQMRAYRPPNIKKKNYHAAAYPEELIYALMSAFSDPEDTVLDPFLGSGTTLKVARHLNRNGIGFELDTDYRELIDDRIREEMTSPDLEELDLLKDKMPSNDSKNVENTDLSEFVDE